MEIRGKIFGPSEVGKTHQQGNSGQTEEKKGPSLRGKKTEFPVRRMGGENPINARVWMVV